MSSAYLELARTFAARSSVVEPVCLEVLRCDSADAASVLAVCEVLPRLSVSDARLAIRPEVCFVFFDIEFPLNF